MHTDNFSLIQTSVSMRHVQRMVSTLTEQSQEHIYAYTHTHTHIYISPCGEPKSICEYVTHTCLGKKIILRALGVGGEGLLSFVLISVQTATSDTGEK